MGRWAVSRSKCVNARKVEVHGLKGDLGIAATMVATMVAARLKT